MTICFKVAGNPQPQARPRTFFSGGRPITFSEKSDFRKQVYAKALESRHTAPLDRALGLVLRFHMRRPKTGHRGALWHITRPDMDNLEKAVMDAITDAKIWRDDSLVAFKRSEKTYSDEFVGVEISITELEDVPHE